MSELLIIDRDTKAMRRWVGEGRDLREVSAGDDGWHELLAVPVVLRGRGGLQEARCGDSVQSL